MDTANDPLYRKMLSSLAPDEELLWSSKPDANCYFRYQLRDGSKGLLFFQVLILIYLILGLIAFHGAKHRIVVTEVVVFEIVGVWLIAAITLSQRENPWEHYAIASNGPIYSCWYSGSSHTRQIPWKHMKSIVVRKEGSDLVTIQINPYFLTGHNNIYFRGISDGENVLGLIWKYRPDLIREASSSHLLAWNEANADVSARNEQGVDGQSKSAQ